MVATTLSILADGTGVAVAVALALALAVTITIAVAIAIVSAIGRKGAANGTELDVGEDNRGITVLGLDLAGFARAGRARASLGTGLGRASRVGRVEPEHVGVVLEDGGG